MSNEKLPWPLSESVHAAKHRQPGETFYQFACRIAAALQDDDAHRRNIKDAVLDQRILFGGRIQASVGTAHKSRTPFNCFVSGVIGDSMESILQRQNEAIYTMRMGGGIGYDFSKIRPNGEPVRSMGSTASGPVSFMELFDAGCSVVSSAGHRRGAQMGVLRIDHPDIVEFVHAKAGTGKLKNFNVSVGVTDEFMIAVHNGERFPLRFKNREVYREIDARALWDEIMRTTWDHAEPGVLFLDQINRMNNLYYCETIAATNPCGEQPLPPYGACLLGSLNLTKYVYLTEAGYRFNEGLMAEDTRTLVRALDNVIDQSDFPLEQQDMEARCKRRMGVGITGLANAGEVLGYPYGSDQFIAFMSNILERIRDEAYSTSSWMAHHKGSCPAFTSDRNAYLSSRFILSLPDYIRERIRRDGIRNSHLLSIAPTGTISLTAGNVSSGIEPVLFYREKRDVRGWGTVEVEDYAVGQWGVKGKLSHEVTTRQHLKVLETAQKYVDSSVSKTINIGPNTSFGDFKHVYSTAWFNGAKGVTTFRDGGKLKGIRNDAACYIDENGIKTCEE